jgi:hypothetical protein
MAKQQRNVSSEATHDDDTLLIRSAESLGRVIGSLQRQLKVAVAQLPLNGNDGGEPRRPKKTAGKHVVRKTASRSVRSTSRKTASAARKSAAKKPAARARASKAKTSRKK